MPKKSRHASSALEVWKFGGASLADAAAIERAAALIASHDGPLVVVVSALAGITDLLLAGAQRAAAGDFRGAATAAKAYRATHSAAAKAIAHGKPRERLLAAIDAAAREYTDVCKGLSMLGHI